MAARAAHYSTRTKVKSGKAPCVDIYCFSIVEFVADLAGVLLFA